MISISTQGIQPAQSRSAAKVPKRPTSRVTRHRLTTQAQRPGTRDATIANRGVMPGSLQRMVRPRHTIPIPLNEPRTAMINSPPATTAITPASNATQCNHVSRGRCRDPSKATPLTKQRTGVTARTTIHGNGVVDHPSLESLRATKASAPTNQKTAELSKISEAREAANCLMACIAV
jgi:hypothetical protein